jgi:hypothetical protein
MGAHRSHTKGTTQLHIFFTRRPQILEVLPGEDHQAKPLQCQTMAWQET